MGVDQVPVKGGPQGPKEKDSRCTFNATLVWMSQEKAVLANSLTRLLTRYLSHLLIITL